MKTIIPAYHIHNINITRMLAGPPLSVSTCNVTILMNISTWAAYYILIYILHKNMSMSTCLAYHILNYMVVDKLLHCKKVLHTIAYKHVHQYLHYQ